MFDTFKNEITTTYTSISEIKFDGKVYFSLNKDGKVSVETRPSIKDTVKKAEEEIGVKSVLEKFKIKQPDSPNVNLILVDKSIWVDIAIEAVRTKLVKNKRDDWFSLDDTDSYFKSMIKHINEIREEKKKERTDEIFSKLGNLNVSIPNTMVNENTTTQKDSSGCIILLPLYFGIGSALYFIIEKFIG